MAEEGGEASWYTDARTLVTASSFGAVLTLAQDGPQAFFQQELIPFVSETFVGWVLAGITSGYGELVRVSRVMGRSLRRGIVRPFRDIGTALEDLVGSWVGWQVDLLEGLAVDMGLASPFVTLVALGIVLIVNAALAAVAWDIADDYLPLQVVTEPVLGSIRTVRSVVIDGVERLTPPYERTGGEIDE